jgi:hypothetical protein
MLEDASRFCLLAAVVFDGGFDADPGFAADLRWLRLDFPPIDRTKNGCWSQVKKEVSPDTFLRPFGHKGQATQ